MVPLFPVMAYAEKYAMEKTKRIINVAAPIWNFDLSPHMRLFYFVTHKKSRPEVAEWRRHC